MENWSDEGREPRRTRRTTCLDPPGRLGLFVTLRLDHAFVSALFLFFDLLLFEDLPHHLGVSIKAPFGGRR